MAVTFPVYMIYSKWSLTQIDNFLKEFGEAEYLRIVYDNKHIETNRTIAILSDEVYKKLCDAGFNESKNNGFKIKPYIVKEIDNSIAVRTLFVPVPKEFCNLRDKVKDIISKKIINLSHLGIINESDWNINIPINTREKGDIKKGCYISFNDNVELERISLIRILLTDTYWPEILTLDSLLSKTSDSGERKIFRCLWERKNKKIITAKQPTLAKQN